MDYYSLAYVFFSNPITWFTIIIVLCFMIIRYAGGFFSKLRKWKIGPVEVENEAFNAHTEISYSCKAMSKRMWSKIDANTASYKEASAIITSMFNLLESNKHALEELRTGQLRLLFYAINAPIEERIYGGLRYIQKGKNGLMKKDIMDLCIDNIDKYKTIILVHPDLVLEDLNNVL